MLLPIISLPCSSLSFKFIAYQVTHIPSTNSVGVKKNSLFFPLGKTSLMMIDGNNSQGNTPIGKHCIYLCMFHIRLCTKHFMTTLKYVSHHPNLTHIHRIAQTFCSLHSHEWGAYINRNQQRQYLSIFKIII